MHKESQRSLARRLSISLPESLASALDQMVQEKGFQTRSQAVAEMVQSQLMKHLEEQGNTVMAGTISLTFQRTIQDCSTSIASVQHKHLRECVASLHVQLENNLTLEVILVQGIAQRLRMIANELIAIKGVVHGNLNISAHILPPLEV